MRNTLQYPVSKEEVLLALEEAFDHEISKGLVGGIVPLALSKAKQFIFEHGPDYFYDSNDPRSEQNG